MGFFARAKFFGSSHVTGKIFIVMDGEFNKQIPWSTLVS